MEIDLKDLTDSGKRKLAKSFGISKAELEDLYFQGYHSFDGLFEAVKNKKFKAQSIDIEIFKKGKGSSFKSALRADRIKNFTENLGYLLKEFSSCTIATHNGKSVHSEHNRRDEKVVDKEEHIKKYESKEERLKSGNFEIWKDEKLTDAYERLFGNAVEGYNARQKDKGRRIDNYLESVKKNKYKNPCYEMIVGVYGRTLMGESICPKETGKEILKEFVSSWKERNPNLEMIGAYYHADEEGEPHIHIDYIPVVHHSPWKKTKKGWEIRMEVETGLRGALQEMGFYGINKKNTAQMQWQKRENLDVEELCKKRGLEIWRPNREYKKHLETQEYKTNRELMRREDEYKYSLKIIEGFENEIKDMQDYLKWKKEKEANKEK